MENAIDINQLLAQDTWKKFEKQDASWLSSIQKLFPQVISQALSVPRKASSKSPLYAMQFSNTHFVWLESNNKSQFVFEYSLKDSFFLCNEKRAQARDLKRLFFRLNSWIEKTAPLRPLIGAKDLQSAAEHPVERVLQFLNAHHHDLKCDHISEICWQSVSSDQHPHIVDSLTHILDALKTFSRKEKRVSSLHQVFEAVASILDNQHFSEGKTLLLTNQYCTRNNRVYSVKLSTQTLAYTEKSSERKTTVLVDVQNRTLTMNDAPIKLSAVPWLLNKCAQMGRDLGSGRAQLFESI